MTVQTAPAARGFATAGFGPAGKRKLEIRQVWAHNVEQEFALIQHAAVYFPYVSMDTEFPGVIHDPNPGKSYNDLTPSERYATLKANVDELHLIQIGLVFAASPTSAPALAFQINLEFDQLVHGHNPASIDFLANHGLDFDAHRSQGVDATVFGELLMSSGLVCAEADRAVTWVAFGSSYDFGYLVKLLTGSDLPTDLPEFLELVRVYFGDKVYDVKHVIGGGRCTELYGGLEVVAKALGVQRQAGTSHQAGSDSALTWDAFRRIREKYFVGDSMRDLAGVLYGLELHTDVAAAPNNGNGGRNRRGANGNGNGRNGGPPAALR